MLNYKKDLTNHFNKEQTLNIKSRFDNYSQRNYGVSFNNFKKWMGLLGIGQCQFLTKKIFRLIAGRKQHFQFKQFLSFLNTISYGSIRQKAELSFNFLDRKGNNQLQYQDIQQVITELCLIWNFLTGQKIHPGSALQIICGKLNIQIGQKLSFQQYFLRYDQHFSWFDYFNSASISNINKEFSHKNQNSSAQFPIDQIQDSKHDTINQMQIHQDKNLEPQNQSFADQDTNLTTDLSIIKGPISVSSQPFKTKGDIKSRDSFKVQSSEQLSARLEDQGFNKFQIMVNKLNQIKKIGYEVLPIFQEIQQLQFHPIIKQKQKNFNEKQKERVTHIPKLHQRNSIVGLSQINYSRKNLVYLGHQSWNLMLNLMLGLRKSLKSHFYFHKAHQKFSSQDLGSKYPNQLIFKKNDEEVTQVCQIFIDYAPKVFSFLRKSFGIQNTQILRSIGFQNLLGNLLMGNLSTLSDQTQSNYRSQITNFTYYTSDLKIIVQSITKQKSNTLRSFLYDYTKYFSQNPQSLLPRIYGLFKLKNQSTNRQIYFILYSNAFDVPVSIDEKYQLSGDPIHRQKNSIADQYLNDCDLLKMPKLFQLQIPQKQRIYNQIQKDVKFLQNHNITDYRLKVGISKEQNCSPSTGRLSFKSVDMKQTYFFTLDNILNQYSTTKLIGSKLDNLFQKGVEYLNPKQYKQRFLKFIARQIFAY